MIVPFVTTGGLKPPPCFIVYPGGFVINTERHYMLVVIGNRRKPYEIATFLIELTCTLGRVEVIALISSDPIREFGLIVITPVFVKDILHTHAATAYPSSCCP